MSNASFFEALWPGGLPARLLIWSDKQSQWCQSLAEIQPAIEKWGSQDIYFGVGLVDDPEAIAARKGMSSRYIRMDASDVTWLPGLWVDIDFEGLHKKGGLPTREHVDSVLSRLEKPPTVVVHSGGGYHCYWLFDEPLRVSGDFQEVSEGWQRYIRSQIGHTMDSVHDLSRVLRVPGSRNNKRAPFVHAEVISDDGPRYPAEVFEPYRTTRATPVVLLDRTTVDLTATVDMELIDILCTNDSFVDPEIRHRCPQIVRQLISATGYQRNVSDENIAHWSGLIGALQHNQNRQQKQVRLFETGLNFIADGDDIDQQSWISGVASGSVVPEQWSADTRMLDFYDVKGDLEALFDHGRNSAEFSFRAESHPALHPGQTARIYRVEETVGWLGVLHPEMEKSLSVEGPVILFEIKTSALIAANSRQFAEISRFPANRRDLAIIVDESVTSRDILETIENIGDNTINRAWIFDVYQGKGIESGRKSIALGLILLDSSRTLTDEDVEETISKVICELGEKLNATLRD